MTLAEQMAEIIAANAPNVDVALEMIRQTDPGRADKYAARCEAIRRRLNLPTIEAK